MYSSRKYERAVKRNDFVLYLIMSAAAACALLYAMSVHT